MKSVGFAPQPSTGQALLPALPTLVQALPIHKGKSLFTEQQYRGYKHCPKRRELPSFRAWQQRVRHATPEKGTTSLPERAFPSQNVSTISSARQESTGEAILVRAPKKSGWRTACALPSALPQPRAARWASQCKDRSWALEILC